MAIFSGTESPTAISEFLGIEPSRTTTLNPEARTINGWFLTTKGKVNSKDCRRHIDWLLDVFFPVTHKVNELQNRGVKLEISCFWSSASGNGGPTLSVKQMSRLVPLSVDIWWDVWFPE
jgi:hypothetical protein